MKGSYDIVAPFYDSLSKLIFGKAIKKSQTFLTDAIAYGNNILIIGGGTGWILEEISAKYSTGLRITYIDVSKKMISLSKARRTGNNEINFINQSVFDVKLTAQYDVVITAYFLDNFNDENVERIINKINIHLVKNGLWLYADFKANDLNFWQRTLSKMMYAFFRVVCNIEATNLAETQSKFERRGFELISSKKFYLNFIYSVIYRKTKASNSAL